MSGRGGQPGGEDGSSSGSPMEQELAQMGLSPVPFTSEIAPVDETETGERSPEYPGGQQGPVPEDPHRSDAEPGPAPDDPREPSVAPGDAESAPVAQWPSYTSPADPPAIGERRGPARRLSAESLTAETVLRPRQRKPTRGWRRMLYASTGGMVNPGPSPLELREREIQGRIRSPLRGCHRIAVMSLKGGVGKTTTTAAIGSMFGHVRGDRIVAVDANPDRGTLAERVPRETSRTVRDLLNARGSVERYSDVRAFTSQAPSRLEVLASDTDPSVSLAFSEAEYLTVEQILERFYSLILTDCGTGLMHSAMNGVLGSADTLVIVGSPNLDAARSASATLDWLEEHGHDELVRRSVAVISTVRSSGKDVDVRALEEHFEERCRAVTRIPYDSHLAEGSVIDVAAMQLATRRRYLELAATLADGFS